MEQIYPYIFLIGVALTAIGALALIVAAFRQRWWWGLLVLLFPPAAVAFAVRYPRRALIPGLVLLLGVAAVGGPIAVNRLMPVDLGPRARVVNNESHVTLTGWDRKDYSILIRTPEVVVLKMANPDVTDETLGYLGNMTRLRDLDLSGTKVTDIGLRTLRGLTSLETLRLRDTAVTDVGLSESLSRLPGLKQLDLRGTKVSAESVDRWKTAGEGRKAMR